MGTPLASGSTGTALQELQDHCYPLWTCFTGTRQVALKCKEEPKPTPRNWRVLNSWSSCTFYWMSSKKLVRHLYFFKEMMWLFQIDTLCGALDAMNLRPGEHVRSFCAEITDDNVFKGIHLTRENGDDASYRTMKTELTTSSKEYFHKRFSNFQEDPVLCGATDLSNPSCGQERGKISSSLMRTRHKTAFSNTSHKA